MEKILYAAAALGFIFLMTTLGAACVFFTGKCGNYRGLNGFSAGVMIAASFWSLLLPAIELSVGLSQPEWLVLSSGVAVGSFFIAFPELFSRSEKGGSRVFRAVTLHNVPEGLSVGIAFGSGGVSVAAASGVALAIGLQNLPEGLATALPFVKEKGRKRAFLLGTASGVVEPVFGVIGLLLAESITVIQPFALVFSAGAMIYVCVRELIPDACSERIGRLAFFVGFVCMTLLDVAFG